MQRLAFNISCALIGIMIIASVSIAVAADNVQTLEEHVVVDNSLILDVRKVITLRMKEMKRSAENTEQDKHCKEKVLPEFVYDGEWNDEDTYLLAKLAKSEAEGATLQCKTLVVLTVINRVKSEYFPNSVHDVIYQYDKGNNVYQFSCIGNGRWDRVEPDAECYEAVEIVRNLEYDYSNGALYFESCKEQDNWHSRNLDFLYQCDELRFYK